ncbi:MliC family protein [Synechococcus sp. BA-124 BA4]|uniref:MliC family protein n=1 Tax=unclassified Synechococcus TaxID=2626047 RepID=UPI0018CE0937|nr:MULTISPECIES: MliC family protein [unclassified Synechococcus]MEA5398519.1 MliC family protein [Synechococcus sp. BA-124 BA4]QPN56849.1 MliC family protein [Synechococcus sp. CBW1107]CAK6696823.1 hypothetical protein BBFGKLBO_02129 [Synechococcus sp. CBW1107]
MVGLSLLRAPVLPTPVVLSTLGAGLGSVLLITQAAIAEPAIRADYRCSGPGETLQVTALFFPENPRQVVLIVEEQAVRLPQAPSGSGARYSSLGQEFWVKGREARWIRTHAQAEQPLTCAVVPQGR